MKTADFWMTEEEAKADRERKLRYENYIRDLKDVAMSASGAAVLLELLHRCGIDGPCSEDPRQVSLRNEGLRLLDEIAEAAPTQWINLLVALRGHPKNNEDNYA